MMYASLLKRFGHDIFWINSKAYSSSIKPIPVAICMPIAGIYIDLKAGMNQIGYPAIKR